MIEKCEKSEHEEQKMEGGFDRGGTFLNLHLNR